jgi:3-hydroxymyristoyl/3-hydroxydecanoyl-(acyl carrier protein) dehydratase
MITHFNWTNECEATLNISGDHPFFAGHFPQNPILPAVAVIEITREFLHQGFSRRGNISVAELIAPLSITNAKFTRPIGPNAFLTLRIQMAVESRQNCRVHWTDNTSGVEVAVLDILLISAGL